jgi:hypothetical protein
MRNMIIHSSPVMEVSMLKINCWFDGRLGKCSQFCRLRIDERQVARADFSFESSGVIAVGDGGKHFQNVADADSGKLLLHFAARLGSVPPSCDSDVRIKAIRITTSIYAFPG